MFRSPQLKRWQPAVRIEAIGAVWFLLSLVVPVVCATTAPAIAPMGGRKVGYSSKDLHKYIRAEFWWESLSHARPYALRPSNPLSIYEPE